MVQLVVKGRLLNDACFEAKEDDYGKSLFSALVVLEDGEEKKLEAAKQQAIEEKFKGKAPKKMMDYVVREGDDEDYENTFEKNFINAKSQRKPKVTKRVQGVLYDTDRDEGLIYPGAYVYASVDVYAYAANPEKKVPAGVTTGFRALCFWKHGENLAGGFNSNEFDQFESEIDDDDEGEDDAEV